MTELAKLLAHYNPWSETWHASRIDSAPHPDPDSIRSFTTNNYSTGQGVVIHTGKEWSAWNRHTQKVQKMLAAHVRLTDEPSYWQTRDHDVKVRQSLDALLRIHGGNESLLNTNLELAKQEVHISEQAGEIGAEIQAGIHGKELQDKAREYIANNKAPYEV